MTSSVNALTDIERKWMEDLQAECCARGVLPRDRFELACYAIVGKGNTKKAMERLIKVRRLEEENDLDQMKSDVAGQVVESASPGCFKAAGQDKFGRPCLFLDFAAFPPRKLKSPHEWRCLMKASRDCFASLSTTISEVREGCVLIASAREVGWHNLCFGLEKRFSSLCQDGYPIKVKAIYITDPPAILTAIIKCCRCFLKKKIVDRIVLTTPDLMIAGKAGNFSADQLPSHLGGSFRLPVQCWKEEALKRREASIREMGPIEIDGGN